MIKRIRASLTAKLLLITAVLLAASAFMTYSFIAWMMPETYRSSLTEGLIQRVDVLITRLRETPEADAAAVVEEFARETRTEVRLEHDETEDVLYESGPAAETLYNGVFVAVATVADDGVDVMDTDAAPVLQEDTAAVTSDVMTVMNDNGSEIMEGQFSVSSEQATTLVYTVGFADSDKEYSLYVSDSMREVNEAEQALQQILPLLVLAIAAMSVLGAVVYSRYVTRPIVKLSGLSERLAALDFTWEYRDGRTDEIGVLGNNLSALAARLSAALEELKSANEALRGEMARELDLKRQRAEFFSAVSHELKTPITIIKGQIEGMLGRVGTYADRDTYLARALAVTESMEGLVQEILLLSRSEAAPERIDIQPTDLEALLRTRIARHEELFAQRGLTVKSTLQPATVQADQAQLAKALDNLLTNAALYSPPGETVDIRLGVADGKPWITIENGGAHIPQEALPHLFEAFYRVDASRNRRTGGSGLGLYIVAGTLGRIGATCTIENTPDGVRCTVHF